MKDEEQRASMVERQLLSRGISDKKVLDTMLRVPRHLFVDIGQRDMAYDDMPLSIGYGQTISQPYMVAIMTQLLELSRRDTVLEIGTGSGYQAAVCSLLAKEVYTIERVEELSKIAIERFETLGYRNIYAKSGDGSLGYPGLTAFDKAIITAAAPDVPVSLVKQLNDGGIIVAPVGERYSQQLTILKKKGGMIERSYSTACIFVPLIGKHGWQA